MEEKNKLAGERWKALSEEEQQSFQNKSKNFKTPDINSLSKDQIKALVVKHKNQLISEVIN